MRSRRLVWTRIAAHCTAACKTIVIKDGPRTWDAAGNDQRMPYEDLNIR